MTRTAWTWPGARWWRCDLHVHTPASYDFSKRETATYERWVEGVRAAGISVVAITDHNTGDGIDKVRAAAGSGLTVFPGVELTVSPGVHMLALFDPLRGRDEVVSLLASCGIPTPEFGMREAISPRSVLDAMAEIHRLHGLVILAHADAEKGVLHEIRNGQDLMRILRSPHLAAVEVKSRESASLRYVDGSMLDYVPESGPLCLVQSSDAHTPEHIGQSSTWIKMTSPTLEGLRLALRDRSLSTRDPLETPNPNEHAPLVIESITVAGARYMGRRAPFEVRFNPWFNAIIGGRGTGKSSVVELLRAALRRQDELPETLRGGWDDMMRAYDRRGTGGILTPDTQVTVLYRKDDAQFRVRWDLKGDDPPIEEMGSGGWVARPGDVRSRFPVRIYSQKQVFELTRDPEALLRIIDEAPEVGHANLVDQWKAEETRFLTLRARAREIESSLSDEPRLQGELDDVWRRLAVFERAGHADLLRRWQLRRRQGSVVDRWQMALGTATDRLSELADAATVGALDDSSFDPSDPVDAALLRAASEVKERMSELQQEARVLAERAEVLRASWPETRSASPWTTAAREAEAAYDKLIEDLEAAGGGDPSEYGRLVQRRQLLEEKLSTFAGKRATMADLQAQSRACLDSLRRLRAEVSDRRSKFVADVLKANPLVRIDIMPMGALDGAKAELRRLLGREDEAFQKDLGNPGEPGTLIGDLCGPYLTDFERATPARRRELTDDLCGRLDALKARLHGIRSGTAKAADSRFAKHLEGRPPEQMDRLDTWFPKDTLVVSFRAGNASGFRPIEQGSPGQRSAALLAFLLSHGVEPIILDQPEDDLDNHLVYDLIVQQLRQLKTRRQLIVVTHNANIVVNGDAELVVALDVQSGQTACVAMGGLQEQAVRDEVCRVMEGGAEAFRERYRRIAQGGGDVRLP